MIPELGHFALILALLLAAVLATLPLVGAHRRIPAWMALARPLAAGQFVVPINHSQIAFALGLCAPNRILGSQAPNELAQLQRNRRASPR